jgi:predicted nucleic acid-binding protein
MYYLDTSVIAAFYCPESLSDAVEKVVAGSVEPIISHLVEVEIASAVSRKVREKSLGLIDARRILSQFKLHVSAGMYSVKAVESYHYSLAGEWIGQCSMPLRTLDALHLAVAFEHGRKIITADTLMAKSAEKLGLDVMLLGK